MRCSLINNRICSFYLLIFYEICFRNLSSMADQYILNQFYWQGYNSLLIWTCYFHHLRNCFHFADLSSILFVIKSFHAIEVTKMWCTFSRTCLIKLLILKGEGHLPSLYHLDSYYPVQQVLQSWGIKISCLEYQFTGAHFS